MRKQVLVYLIATLFFLQHCSSGSGGGTPAADIPAPVSHLSISSPDDSGEVRITAEAGFTDAQTTVTITNPNGVSFNWLDLLIPNAWAHATHTVTSNSDGSFQETIEASVGDLLTITYTADGEELSVEEEVPSQVPPLPLTADIQDISINPIANEALVVANDGADGFVYVIDLDDGSFESTITLSGASGSGASGAFRIATDPATGDSLVLDRDNVTAIHITGDSVVSSTTAIIDSSDLAAGLDDDYMIIAHTDPTPALSYFDLNVDSATAIGDAQSEGGEAQQSALFVSIDNDGTSDIAAVVSLMGDGSFLLTTHLIDTAVPSITQDNAIPLTDIENPGGLVLFNNASEALVTDADNNRVYRILLSDGSLTAINVGNSPLGVAVDETAGEAYVVNNEDRSLTTLSLADNSVVSTTNLGLSPSEIAADSATSSVITVNTGDETVSILE